VSTFSGLAHNWRERKRRVAGKTRSENSGLLPAALLCCCGSRRALTRRSFLLGCVGATVSACAAVEVRTAAQEVAQFPLIDNHSHLLPQRLRPDLGTTPEDLLRAMDAAGIRRMVVAGFGPEVADLPLRYPGRFVAAYVLHNFRWRQDPRAAALIPERQRIRDGTSAQELEWIGGEFDEALASGRYHALAEITTIARPIPGAAPGRAGMSAPGANVAPDSPLVLRLIELAGRHDVPINIHCEDYAAARMENALRAQRRTRIIWAHTGSYLPPVRIAQYLRAHPNLDFDLSSKNLLYAPRAGSLVSFGRLDEAWRLLFEAFPERFHFGVDFLTRHHLEAAPAIGEYARAILSQLSPSTARRIAHLNAERAYRLG
jgi:hypothetical protein